MNRRRFLLASCGLFTPTIVRAVVPIGMRRLSAIGRIPDWTFKTNLVGVFNAIFTMSGLVPIWDFGDGSQVEASSNTSHTYTKAGTKTINVYLRGSPTLVTAFRCYSMGMVTLPDLRRFKNCTLYDFWNSPIIATLPALDSVTALAYLHFSTATLIYTSSNLPITLNDFYLNECGLSKQSVDGIGVDFVTNLAARPAIGTLNVAGPTNSAPTVTTDYDAIAAHGWTVTHN